MLILNHLESIQADGLLALILLAPNGVHGLVLVPGVNLAAVTLATALRQTRGTCATSGKT